MQKLYLWEKAALLALCLALLSGVWAEGRQAALAQSLLRLHVLAVSDEPEEQALKLRVRDAVLTRVQPLLRGAGSAAEAEAILSGHLSEVQRAAEEAAEGRAVTLTLTAERFPTRDYGSFVLPAGRYKALRVVLGEGRGHNWWCVVFPTLCLRADEDTLREVLAPEDFALVSEEEGYELRFRILELWGELFGRTDGTAQ